MMSQWEVVIVRGKERYSRWRMLVCWKDIRAVRDKVEDATRMSMRRGG